MSPRKFEETSDQATKGMMINGPRPAQLRINKDSHFINKSSSSQLLQPPAFDNSAPSKPQSVPPKRQPVIIYTHSPKIIHAQARDFMALVQKLTGLSRPEDNGKTAKSDPAEPPGTYSGVKKREFDHEESCPSTLLGEEKLVGQVKQESSFKDQNDHYSADAPLYISNSGDFYYSSRPCNPSFQTISFNGVDEYYS